MNFFATAGNLMNSFSGVAGRAMVIESVFDLAYADRKKGQPGYDPEAAVAKPVLKMALAGMLM